MAITYTTNIKHLRGAPNLDDLEKVITAVEFEIIGVDGEHTHNALGDLPLTLDKDNFTNFNLFLGVGIADFFPIGTNTC